MPAAGSLGPAFLGAAFDDRFDGVAQDALVDRAAHDQRHPALRVDQEVLRDAGRAERFAALVADRAQLRIGGFELVDESAGVAAVVLHVDAEDGDAVGSVAAVEGLELGRLLAAWPAPGSP